MHRCRGDLAKKQVTFRVSRRFCEHFLRLRHRKMRRFEKLRYRKIDKAETEVLANWLEGGAAV